jgi:hypothetical protein
MVAITASSFENAQTHPLRTVADFESRAYFATANEPNSWVCYDFKDYRITPTHYVIRTHYDRDTHHLQSWILEGSVDGQSWIRLDQRIEETSLKSIGAIAAFVISKSSQVQMIRVRQVGTNSSGYDRLVIDALEIFGGVIPPEN